MNLVLNEKHYRDVMGVQWNNRYTDRLRRDLHDPKVCVGWDAENSVWLFGYLVRQQVKRAYGVRGSVSFEDVPFVWHHWREDAAPDGTPGAALPIEPYTRVLEYIRGCDRLNTQAREDQNVADALAAASQRSTERDHRLYVVGELRKPIAALAEASGTTYHRPTGNEARRITSAGLWRRGAGA